MRIGWVHRSNVVESADLVLLHITAQVVFAILFRPATRSKIICVQHFMNYPIISYRSHELYSIFPLSMPC